MDPTLVRRRLITLGFVLFLLGLLTGLGVPAMANPRMGVSAHLEGVMNGAFLLGVGLAWGELRLAPGAGKAAYWLLLYGTFANWAATLLSGLWGTSRLTPLAGAGHVGSKLQEDVVQALLVSLSLAMVVSVGLLAWGAFARLREER